jgi:serine/threonine protein kinase
MRVLFLIPKNNPPQLEGPFSKAFKEFVQSCLAKDPMERPTCKDLLKHRFLKTSRRTSHLVDLIERYQRWKESHGENALSGDDESTVDLQTGDKSGGTMRWDFGTVRQAGTVISENSTGTVKELSSAPVAPIPPVRLSGASAAPLPDAVITPRRPRVLSKRQPTSSRVVGDAHVQRPNLSASSSPSASPNLNNDRRLQTPTQSSPAAPQPVSVSSLFINVVYPSFVAARQFQEQTATNNPLLDDFYQLFEEMDVNEHQRLQILLREIQSRYASFQSPAMPRASKALANKAAVVETGTVRLLKAKPKSVSTSLASLDYDEPPLNSTVDYLQLRWKTKFLKEQLRQHQ